MTFLGVDGDRLRISSTVDPGAGPPMHVHHLQTETIRVERGRIGVRDRRRGAASSPAPASTLTFDPGVVHRFWNAGDDELVLTGEVFPADNLEYFLTQVYASVAAHGGRPGAFDAAFLLTRYRSRVRDDLDPRCRSAASSSRSRPSSAASSAATATSPTPRPRSAGPRALHSPAARPAPVAQLDRASVYGTEGQRFESSRAR